MKLIYWLSEKKASVIIASTAFLVLFCIVDYKLAVSKRLIPVLPVILFIFGYGAGFGYYVLIKLTAKSTAKSIRLIFAGGIYIFIAAFMGVIVYQIILWFTTRSILMEIFPFPGIIIIPAMALARQIRNS